MGKKGDLKSPGRGPRLKLNSKVAVKVKGKVHHLKALVDTGNSVDSDVVLDEETARELNLEIKPLLGRTVGTAKKENSLKLVGESADFLLRIGDRPKVYKVKAIVVNNLSQRMNIGAKFLLREELDLKFRRNEGISLVDRNGDTVTELVQELGGPSASASPNISGEYCVFNDVNDDIFSNLYQQIEQEPAKIEIFESKVQMMEAKVEKLCVPNGKVETLNTFDAKVDDKVNDFIAKDATNFSQVDPRSESGAGGAKGGGSFAREKGGGEVTVLQEGQSVGLKLSKPVMIPNNAVNVIRFNLPSLPDEEVLISCLNSGTVEEVRPQKNNQLIPGLYRVQKEEDQHFVEVFMVSSLDDTDKLAQAQDDSSKEGVHQLYVELPADKILGIATKVKEAKFSIPENICEVGCNEGDQVKVGTEGSNEDFEQLLRELKVNENTMLKANKKAKSRLVRMLRRFQDCFTLRNGSNKYGCTTFEEMKIKVKPGQMPVKQKVRPLNPAQEEVLRDQIHEWEKNGIIEKSKSEWASPVVLVKKKQADPPWRVCIDYRRLNAATEGDSYPLPRVEHLLSRAGGHKVYSALDASSAYHTIPLEEESRPLTAFVSPMGLYQFLRVPFGLKQAGSVYSRFIDAALSQLGSNNINIYLDDVLIFHDSLHQHLDRLEEVLEVHQKAGIRINARKTHLLVEECDYLGHRLSAQGISMVPEYVERVMNWPEPTSIKELNTFLGFVTYYRHFITDFSQLTSSMMEQKRKKKLVWTSEMRKNMQLLKEKFRGAPIRAVPDFGSDEKFILTCDYSGTAISSILSQVQNGAERLISVGGRKCTPPESRYASWKGELSAVVNGIRKYEPILRFRPFIVITDSSCIKHLQTMERPKGLAGRWLDELQSYDFEVIHRPGRLNKNADSVSRAKHLPDPTPEEVAEHQEYVCALSRPELRAAQLGDPVLKEVNQWLDRKETPSKEEMRGKVRDLHVYRSIFGALDRLPDGTLIYKETLNDYEE